MYNILDITEEYILSKENDNILKVYIYEIDPIPIINISEDTQKNILNSYVTFLREINIDFQILVINKKLNIENMFQNNNNEIYNKYLENMRIKIKEDKIFCAKYYIVVSLKKQNNIDELDKAIGLLKNCGCNVSRLKNKKDIEELLYECINKEEI